MSDIGSVDSDSSGTLPSGARNQIDELDNPTTEEFNSFGRDCELHIYERRYDTRGEAVMLRIGATSKVRLPQNKSHRAALVLKRLIKKVLHEIIGNHADVRFDTESPTTIDEPAECLFHHRKKIMSYTDNSDDSLIRDHLRLLLQYMEKSLCLEIRYHEEALEKGPQECSTDLHNLWIFFKPGDLIYENINGTEIVSRLQSIHPEYDDIGSKEITSWNICSERIQYTGSEFGYTERDIEVDKFHGRKLVRKLSAFPLDFHPEKDRIKNQLTQRGRKYMSLRGIKHCFYNDREKSKRREGIMLDRKAFMLNAHFCGDSLNLSKSTFRDDSDSLSKLTDSEYLIFENKLCGYGLISKDWSMFDVLHIQEVKYEEDSFDRLVIADDNRKLISALVASHGNELDDFDDHITGKGRGLVFLLHGPPGVGKTFTAESIAESSRRPLFSMNSGDLVGFQNVELKLSRALSLATTWRAIVLLDEADVFLQARDFASIDRNSLVSVLLRVLEYFEGIIFLTTNRVRAIDTAVLSRVHLAITYPQLQTNARCQLWKDWITKVCSNNAPSWLDQECLDRLSSKEINGRDIKNVMRTAYILARHERRDVMASDIYKVLEMKAQFAVDFSETVLS
ncbi:hypothetical protein S40293_07636 [Stachybotrys chartarum IBT 40293]|nr:hypothetical protein S40293_07636 [Stachybotrys chartarum IBT 40293]